MNFTTADDVAIRDVVTPLALRHAEDAAFYCQQFDTSHREHSLRAHRLLHFSRLLAAHIERLHVAGHTGFLLSLDALRKL
jgi:hypothetical protein